MDLSQVGQEIQSDISRSLTSHADQHQVDAAVTLASQLGDGAKSLESSIADLNGFLAEVGGIASQMQQLQPSQITSEASLRAARDVGEQMTLMASHTAAVTTQLALQRIPLARAVAALTASTADEPHQGQHPEQEASDAAAAAQTQEEPSVRGPSYRLVFRSGKKPINEPPALARELQGCILGSLQPWELARLRPAIGRRIFHQAAQQYTHLTMDSDDDEARGMWERMSCDMAHSSGAASSSATVKDGIESAAPPLRHPPSHATLQVLRFDMLEYGIGTREWHPLGPPPTAPVHLPALTTVIDVQPDHAPARVGRNWHTPNVRVLTFQGTYSEADKFEGARQWIGDGTQLEKLEYNSRGNESYNDEFLSGVPEGKSLSGLRSLGRVSVTCEDTHGWWEPADMRQFRNLLVRRGCVQCIREMHFNLALDWIEDSAEQRQMVDKAAELTDTVMHPDAISRQLIPEAPCGGFGTISLQLLAWSRAHRSPTAEKLVTDYAMGVSTVIFDDSSSPRADAAPDEEQDEDERQVYRPYPVTPATFPQANKLTLPQSSLPREDIGRAVEVATSMPRLEHIDASSSGVAVGFLQAFHAAAPDRAIGTVTLQLPLKDLSSKRCTFDEWGKSRNMLPAIERITLSVVGNTQDGSKLERLHANVVALMQQTSHVKGAPRIDATFSPHGGLAKKISERFASAHALFNLSSSSTKLQLEWAESDRLELTRLD
ncbi:unnamed protein product [Vitrella brassicaformis CCMP3155]|uniref:Uncharacterized protein n=1 Tax=Vitrella brassicaformis (strain CCMP3155) TaxID=1169540 RepID=A0A0G4G7Q2_VITBC|nr:unnamed protein product [Vitrella brassicaformis CCMP3155]|eukprot:CEM24735.1 unnamed protein product [Vitrella brassicaformis CCMP3155]